MARHSTQNGPKRCDNASPFGSTVHNGCQFPCPTIMTQIARRRIGGPSPPNSRVAYAPENGAFGVHGSGPDIRAPRAKHSARQRAADSRTTATTLPSPIRTEAANPKPFLPFGATLFRAGPRAGFWGGGRGGEDGWMDGWRENSGGDSRGHAQTAPFSRSPCQQRLVVGGG